MAMLYEKRFPWVDETEAFKRIKDDVVARFITRETRL